MKRILIAGIAAGALLLSGTAAAIEKPGQWYVAPMASVLWADRDRLVDDDIGAALSFGRSFDDGLNIELHAFGYQLDGIDDTDYWGVGVDLMRVFYRSSRISPYLSLGAGWNKKNRAIGEDRGDGFANAAFGFLSDLQPGGAIALRTELRLRLDSDKGGLFTSQFNDLMLNIGLQFPFGSPYAEPAPPPPPPAPPPPPPPPPPPLDSDGDGVPDYRDQCPDTPPGVEVDAVGCPLDSDGDGVPDYRDDCPGTPPGTRVDSRGCPIADVINLEGVTFAFNSDQIASDERGILNEAVDILNRYSGLQVEVAGHTDSVGALAYNMTLSERRARSVVEYLAREGIDRNRMTGRGYGPTEPVADNATDAGRAMNRRVELRILN